MVRKELATLRSAKDHSELIQLSEMLLIGLTTTVKRIMEDEMEDAYIHGFESAASEGKAKVIKAERKIEISFNQADQDAIHALKNDSVQTKSYGNLSERLSAIMNKIIADSISEGHSVPTTVSNMQKAVNLEASAFTRIARTELINIVNEGRLSAYKKMEKKRKKQFKYTLVVAGGLRTCDAHRELSYTIPSKGLPIDDLIELQQRIGSKHGMALRGNSLLHPNQRTVLMRVP